MIGTDTINLIITIALLVIVVELKFDSLNEKKIKWERTNIRALSALAKARYFKPSKERTEEEKIKEEKIKKHAEKLNLQIDSIKKINIYVKAADRIRLLLPILLTFEVIHTMLQKFEWSPFYEWIYLGFNKIFLIIIMMIVLTFFIVMIIIRKKEEELSDYILYNTQVISEQEFGVL